MVPSAGVNIGLFEFERPDNAELAVLFWTSAAPPRLDRDDLTLRLWSTNGISLAVVGDQANRDLDQPPPAFFAFYRKSFRA